jgi:hypothetical protein
VSCTVGQLRGCWELTSQQFVFHPLVITRSALDMSVLSVPLLPSPAFAGCILADDMVRLIRNLVTFSTRRARLFSCRGNCVRSQPQRSLLGFPAQALSHWRGKLAHAVTTTASPKPLFCCLYLVCRIVGSGQDSPRHHADVDPPAAGVPSPRWCAHCKARHHRVPNFPGQQLGVGV